MKKTAYLLSKGFFYAFSVFFLFVLAFSILAFAEYKFGWDVPFVEITNQDGGEYAFIKIPLIEMSVSFVYNILVVFVMWIGLLFYAIFFYVLKEFFKVFVEDEAFNTKSLKRLKSFFYINLIPLGYVIVLSIVQLVKTGGFKFEEDHGVALAHLFIAFLVYLYMDLLKKGKVIQEENELTI